MTPCERILAAVDLSPDRSRVTIRRDDARWMLDQLQFLTGVLSAHETEREALDATMAAQTAEIDRLTTACVRLEQMVAQHCDATRHVARERDAAIGELAEMAQTVAELRRRPSWLELWMSWAMLPAAAVGAVLVCHG